MYVSRRRLATLASINKDSVTRPVRGFARWPDDVGAILRAHDGPMTHRRFGCTPLVYTTSRSVFSPILWLSMP